MMDRHAVGKIGRRRQLKRVWLCLVACLGLCVAATGWAKEPRPTPVPGSVYYLDSKNGFRDLKFGSTPTKDMELARVDGDERIYQRPKDSLEIGDGKCKQILYVFYKNRLHTVQIVTGGRNNSRAVRDALYAAYGKPTLPSEYGGRDRWIGGKVVAEYSEDADGGAITQFTSLALVEPPADTKKEADTAKGKKGIDDL
jgi:hypothetical protein